MIQALYNPTHRLKDCQNKYRKTYQTFQIAKQIS